MTKDPVCGMQVDEKNNPPKSYYQGTEQTFCSQDCKQKFDRNPQQYVGQSRQQSQGQQSGQHQPSGQGQQSGQSQKTRQSGGGSGA